MSEGKLMNDKSMTDNVENWMKMCGNVVVEDGRKEEVKTREYLGMG